MSDEEPAEIIYQGIAASPGVSHGSAFVFLRKELEVPFYQIPEERIKAELQRLEQALVETREQILGIRNQVADRLGEEEATIFDAHLMVVEDKALIDETIKEVTETSCNIEYCFNEVAERFIDAFNNIDDEYLRERASDIKDVSHRILRNLTGATAESIHELSDQRIIICEDMTPSDTASLEKGKLLGILTDVGSRTSHAVIMARSLEIPAVVGLHDISQKVDSDADVLIDGYEGFVFINPSKETLYRYGRLQKEKAELRAIFHEGVNLPATTQDGKSLRLYANIEGAEDIAKARECGAEGVGLFRTETIFLRGNSFPNEHEQYEQYKAVVEAFGEQEVIIRTLDLGGDKVMLKGVIHNKEDNPFMGFRAIRFCLEHVEVFKEQLRAILRASAHGNCKVMYPMVSGVGEVLEANQVLEECKKELKAEGHAFNEKIPVGCMIEIPSAAFATDLLAQHVSFFSIGTNDLIQYMLAVDRVNDRIAHLYEPRHPAILRMINHVITEAARFDVPVGICGEMGGDPLFAPLLFGMGAHELSATPPSLPELRYIIRNMKMQDAQSLTQKVLKSSDPKNTQIMLKRFYDRSLGQVLKK